jgi:hypothetical protein
MTRLSRLVLGAVLVIAAACSTSGAPTAPTSASSNTMSPRAEPLFVEGDSTCRNGWDTPNGKAC